MQVLFLCFIIIPIVEMVLLIKVGSLIGAGYTVLMVLLTAMIGVSLLKKQGLQTLLSANRKMNAGQMPLGEMAAGIMLAVAGALLLTPGFVTDAVGFLLLSPQVRKLVAAKWAKAMLANMQTSSMYESQGHYRSSATYRAGPDKSQAPDVIEGEFKEVSGESPDEKNKPN